MPSRQTQSYLRNLFARRGIAPRHRFGQNFLIDLNIHELIVNAAGVGPEDVVLEVGPGAGALTALMAEQASAAVAVEIDPAMARLTAEATSGRPNVRIIEADALAGKNRLNPVVLDSVRAGLAVSPDRRLKLVANLPYNVATPIVTNLLVHPELCPSLMVVTIQLELAERMRAAPASAAYGALSVLVQALADFEIVRVLKPKVFWPRPQVDSAVIKLTPSPERRAAIADLPWFHSVVRKVFLHRRKVLRRVVGALWRDALTQAEVDELLAGLGLDPQIRAEALNVDEFRTLATALRERLETAPTTPDDDTGEERPIDV
ncbi:MAG TPA: 16S rRNA (adenine(1518)-N(6)/adenine(1519)-N(6))-dimethyltransferase RsmA [Isosphaeraceae bacterium]|jgi:16S rRNA (adenine1518-N6/adenine1519-N6)-dimethyltransferase|nr:16S rRNA (adenine(1518)-N(6)/adenine(1519)-N(6))-dimethyltransferase RsmA [Isosphaeraceae bacterium]